MVEDFSDSRQLLSWDSCLSRSLPYIRVCKTLAVTVSMPFLGNHRHDKYSGLKMSRDIVT